MRTGACLGLGALGAAADGIVPGPSGIAILAALICAALCGLNGQAKGLVAFAVSFTGIALLRQRNFTAPEYTSGVDAMGPSSDILFVLPVLLLEASIVLLLSRLLSRRLQALAAFLRGRQPPKQAI